MDAGRKSFLAAVKAGNRSYTQKLNTIKASTKLALPFTLNEADYLSDRIHDTMVLISASLTVFAVAGMGMVP